ncbi:hypothetical protein HOD75_05245 [archaeon]|jgi:hypothetical protein|nr:hypothetical protein [Candidatus Woesearchaeota archaeon]MBT4136136.1 hypothetical protein [archaeon]MBT4242267.1 hypothetical protein [archaeon]MBT4417955.1 hypothetical protein [archaeon]
MEEPPLEELDINGLPKRKKRAYILAYEKAQHLMIDPEKGKGDPERIRPYIEIAEIEAQTRRTNLRALLFLSHVFGQRRFSDGHLTPIQRRAFQDAYTHPYHASH